MREESAPAGTIKSGTRLLRVVAVLQEHDGLGVSELAERLGKPKGTVHRYLKTLDAHGYVVNRDGRYELSLRFLDHGVYAQRRSPMYRAAREKIAELAADLGERAWTHVEERGVGVFVDSAAGRNAVAMEARVGFHAALHTTSGGKAMLAQFPRSRVERIVEQRGLRPRTDRTIHSAADLHAELDRVRERGYALNLEESIDGLHAVGVAVVGADGEVVGAISISGAAQRLTEERCRGAVAERVLAAANEVELDLTYGFDGE